MSNTDLKKAESGTDLTREEIKQQVVESISAIKDGPRAMRMYMELCAKCGTCASVCPVYYGKSEKRYNPAERTDLIRRIYNKYNTTSGKLFGRLAGAEDFDPDDLEDWQKIWYECTGCRRCAVFCPFGIDHSVITRKGRAILDKLGMTPDTMAKVVAISLETGNTDSVGVRQVFGAIQFGLSISTAPDRSESQETL